MTRLTANIVILVMAGVWAWLSIQKGELLPVSQNFIVVGGMLAGGELVSGSGILERAKQKLGVKKENTEVT